MSNSADPDQPTDLDQIQISQLIWIYTVCKGWTYPGSAGLGLRHRLFLFYLIVTVILIFSLSIWAPQLFAVLIKFECAFLLHIGVYKNCWMSATAQTCSITYGNMAYRKHTCYSQMEHILTFKGFVCHYWQRSIFIKCVKCYCLCVLRWLMRPSLALNCLLQVDQERTEEDSSVGDALALPFRWARFCSVSLILYVVLRFYGPVNPMGSCRARSVYLTTRLLGRLSPPSG